MSDILIRMEMPKGCAECKLNSDTICVLINGCIYDESNGFNRRPDCPLVELPEHGDLVDRDWLTDVAYDKVEYFGGAYVDTLDLAIAPVIVPASEEATK